MLLLLVASQLLVAQEVAQKKDSIHTLFPIEYEPLQPSFLDLSPGEILFERTKKYTPTPPQIAKPFYNFAWKETLRIPYQVNPSPLFKGDYRTGGALHQWRRGVLFASGGQTSLAGIGRYNEASLGYQHRLGDRFTFQVGVNAMKLNMMQATGQTFSTSGSLMYQASDRVSFKVFGTYDMGNPYGMSTHRYGGTMTVEMSDRFGMEMGVQRYYNAMRGGWETVPVVIPTYKFNEKFKLGLDVGGIVYEILRSTVFKPSGNGGPTIGPPRLHP